MISKSVEETGKVAKELALSLRAKSADEGTGATIVALSGDLGSGKTTFTKAFAEAFGVNQDEVTSPTFVIMKSYDISANAAAQAGGFRKLVHIDAYRLETPEQAGQIGWDALVADPANLMLVEWPEKLGEKIPKDRRNVLCTFVDETTREIVL